MSNILICDDEKDIVSALRICLAAEGYEIFEAYNGIQALEIIKANDIHLVLLDIMMPEMDGISTLAKIRERYNMPVLFISAKSEDADKILGLNIGADDYITKPFNIIEVVARVKSNLRRYMRLGSNVSSSRIEIRGLCLDDNEKTVAVDGEEINLTPTEYEILKLLMQSPGKVFSPREIYERVWKETLLGSENTVAVHIRHLREKLEINPADPRYIKVVWGQGYKIQGAGR
ncbi:MAG: response regulator transcription factor [Eubacteriales bacterium]|nr:response regulator transcription factor [Clostridiales bacterium]MDD7307997.1 response regulator transcription factor [Eubacteriales bacterium]MDY2933393.1 response regulator transcription factor [Anaerovoracaceae bacterium]